MSAIDTTTNVGQILAGATGGKRRRGDRVFSNLAVISGIGILGLLAGVAIFLLIEALPAITAPRPSCPRARR